MKLIVRAAIKQCCCYWKDHSCIARNQTKQRVYTILQHKHKLTGWTLMNVLPLCIAFPFIKLFVIFFKQWNHVNFQSNLFLEHHIYLPQHYLKCRCYCKHGEGVDKGVHTIMDRYGTSTFCTWHFKILLNGVWQLLHLQLFYSLFKGSRLENNYPSHPF